MQAREGALPPPFLHCVIDLNPPSPMETSPPPQNTITPFARAIRNAGYLLGGSGVGAAFGFLTIVFATRSLGLRDYGILILIHAFAGALATGTRLQTWQPMLQFGTALHEAKERMRFQTLLRHCLMLDGVGGLVAVIIGVPVALFCGHWLGWGHYEKVAALYVTCALFMNTGASMGVMQLADRYKMLAIADNLGAFIRFVGSVAGFLLHWKLSEFLVFWYLSIVTAFATDCFLLWRLTHLIPSLRGFGLKTMAWLSQEDGFWKLLWPTSADMMLTSLSTRAGTLVIGSVLGGAGVAICNVAGQVGSALMQPASFIIPALYPEFVRMRDKQDWQGLHKTTWRICKWLAIFSAIVVVVTYFAAPTILTFMLGKQVDHAREILLWCVGGGIAGLIVTPLEPLLVSLGHAKAVLYTRFLVLLPYLPLLYLCADKGGILGAVIAGCAVSCVIAATRLGLFAKFVRSTVRQRK